MSIYIAPQFQNNKSLEKYSIVLAEVVDIKVLLNQTWGINKDVKLTEITFKTDCNHIVVQKEIHSIGKTSMLNRLYYSITGKNIDINVGFHTNEILNQTITATVNKYQGNGYEGTSLIDFK